MSLTLFDGFEDGDVSEWTVNNLSAVQDRVYNGSWSGYCGTAQSGQPQASRTFDIGNEKISTLEIHWQETSNSTGHGYRLMDSNGNPIIGIATNNPQWDIDDANGGVQVYGGDGYDRWVRTTIQFNWFENTCDITFEDLQSGTKKTYSGRPLKSTNDVDKIQIEDYNNQTWQEGNSIDAWTDDISYDILKTASGTVTENGTSIDGATVELINQDTQSVYRTTTDVNGDWSVQIQGGTYHFAVRYEDGEGKKRTLSKPYINVS